MVKRTVFLALMKEQYVLQVGRQADTQTTNVRVIMKKITRLTCDPDNADFSIESNLNSIY